MVRASLMLCILASLFPAPSSAQPMPDELQVGTAPPPAEPSPEPLPQNEQGLTPSSEDYGATARVDREGHPEVATETGMPPEDVPGTFGDPFRIVESMPGATPMVSGLPYVYVRGSPPSGNAFYYDDIPLPQLYHLGVGPAVLHPFMLGGLHFEPGVSSARFGRRLGASIYADGPTSPQNTRGVIEARLLDANAALAVAGEDTHLMAAGRFGYPGIIAPAIGLDLNFSYWDYQARGRYELNERDYVEVVLLGSRDDLDDAQAVGASIGYEEENQRLQLEFHRVELRLVREQASQTTGLAFRLGSDLSEVGTQLYAESVSMAPRIWLTKRLSGGHVLSMGADLLATVGQVQDLPRSESFGESALSAVTRDTLGAFVDAEIHAFDSVTLGLGLRADAWIIGGEATPSIDPRLRATWFFLPDWSLHAGIGLVHQPVVFSFPLPGFTDVALDRGLQEAIQAEAGLEADLPEGFRFEGALFVHRYDDLLLPEIYLRALGTDADRVSALSYGAELFLRRGAEHDLSGFVSYTLGFARAQEPGTGRSFAPEFDIRHVFNAVLQYRVIGGLTIGVSARFRTGRPANQFTDQGVPPYYELRLPGFARLDAKVGYSFTTDFADMTVYAEMLNATMAREVVDAECFFGTCQPVYQRAIFFPNLGVRAAF